MLHLHYKPILILSSTLSCILLSQVDAAVPAKEAKKNNDAVKVQKEDPDALDGVSQELKAKIQSEIEAQNTFHRILLEKQKVLLEKELSGIVAEIERLRLKKEQKRLHREIEDEAAREAHHKAVQSLQMKKEKLIAEIELAQVTFNKQMEQSSIQIAQLDRKVQLEKGKTQLLLEQKNRLQAEVDAFQMIKNREKFLSTKPIYLKDPLRKSDNVLVLSDRSVQLNGIITPWKANYIADQIQYFNNQNNLRPIFILIDASPGGSVLAGLKILQTMKQSKAPVYVVVKSYAASMAAMIATLASKSYVYPNAVILHHQPWTWSWGGNVRSQQEEYEKLLKIWQRLGGSVAKKMGISLKELDKKLYEKSLYGDWQEYGDNAKKIKWVDVVINGADDSALAIFPDASLYSYKSYVTEYYDMGGESEIADLEKYHRLCPHDFNYSYNPNASKKAH